MGKYNFNWETIIVLCIYQTKLINILFTTRPSQVPSPYLVPLTACLTNASNSTTTMRFQVLLTWLLNYGIVKKKMSRGLRAWHKSSSGCVGDELASPNGSRKTHWEGWSALGNNFQRQGQLPSRDGSHRCTGCSALNWKGHFLKKSSIKQRNRLGFNKERRRSQSNISEKIFWRLAVPGIWFPPVLPSHKVKVFLPCQLKPTSFPSNFFFFLQYNHTGELFQTGNYIQIYKAGCW